MIPKYLMIETLVNPNSLYKDISFLKIAEF